jgi:hypothetical protein
MAASVNAFEVAELGNIKVAVGELSPGVYATNGVAIAIAAPEKFEKIQQLFVQLPGYTCSWDRSNQKLKVFRQKDPGNAGGADIALPEVGDTVDLAAVSGSFIATGF